MNYGNKINSSSYFEINEDGNLHLKIEPESITSSEHDKVIKFLMENENILSCGVNCTTEKYKQWSYVVFEWDIGLMNINVKHIECVQKVADIINNALDVLK